MGGTTIFGKFIGDTQPGLEGGSGWSWREKTYWIIAITIWGGLGSLLDSLLGGWFQASVIETRRGMVIEGAGGKKVGTWLDLRRHLLTLFEVLVHGVHSAGVKANSPESRKVESGLGLLDNNDVNVLMAVTMSIGGMILAGYAWNQPLSNIFT